MCQYWRKLHTCNHPSDRPYLEMCKSSYLNNTVCSEVTEDPEPRKSHFPCWFCIKSEYRKEVEAEAAAKATSQMQKAAEAKAREERVRHEAREKASREREEEARRKAEREAREEWVKKEGGLWIETGSGKKGKGRKGVSALPGPVSAPPIIRVMAVREKKGNDVTNSGVGEGGGKKEKEKEKSLDLGGRAGTWGPKKTSSPESPHPKKILSRKENIATKETSEVKK